MIEQELKEQVRNPFLGEIETEIVGMQYHKAKINPGEQINLEREAKNANDRRAIRVENGHVRAGRLSAQNDGFVAGSANRRGENPSGRLCAPGFRACEEEASRCPVNLMVFQCEKGHRLLEKTEPQNELEALHQTVLQAYQNAQAYRNPELILGLAKGLKPLEKHDLLPETRLLLALLPRMAHELRSVTGHENRRSSSANCSARSSSASPATTTT